MTPLPLCAARRLVLLCALALSFAAQADVFGFVDEAGVAHFSDQASDPRDRLLWKDQSGTAPVAPATHKARHPRTTPAALTPIIETAAREHAVDARLLRAVIAVESGFNPRAVSPRGAQGLMQLMPATARQLGVADPFDPTQNILGGARYLRQLLDTYDGDVSLVLAAYNAGEGAVARHGRRIPPYAETRAYVPRVLALRDAAE